MAAKAIGVDQRFELLAKLGANTNWDGLDSSGIQALIDSPHNAGLQFTEFLRNGGKVKFELKAFPTWKTIKLGTGLKTADDFRKAIEAAGMKIGDWGNGFIGKPVFTASDTAMDVELVNVSVAELGFADGATLLDIQAKADKLGLDPCPAEVGPQLRLQYADQPKGEWLIIAMKPIAGSRGRLRVFRVGHDGGGRWLDGYGSPDYFWDGYGRFVFVRRK